MAEQRTEKNTHESNALDPKGEVMETAFDLLILLTFALGVTAVGGALMRAPLPAIAAFTVPASVCFIVALLIQRGAS